MVAVSYFSFGVILCVTKVGVGNLLITFDHSCVVEVYLKIRGTALIFYHWLVSEEGGILATYGWFVKR